MALQRQFSGSSWLTLRTKEKNYARYEDFIYTRWSPVPPDQHLSLRLASRWASIILPGSALALPAGHASCRVHVGSGKSALSGLPKLSFMTIPPLLHVELLRGLAEVSVGTFHNPIPHMQSQSNPQASRIQIFFHFFFFFLSFICHFCQELAWSHQIALGVSYHFC